MQQLSLNRHFKHKFFKNCIIQSFMKKSDAEITPGVALYNLYIKLVSGDDLIGMSGQTEFMLATGLHQDKWTTMLEEWAKNNQYVDFYPHRMSSKDAEQLLLKCRNMKSSGLRLGQAIINELGENTPTPNIQIFNSKDEGEILHWFYNHHLLITSDQESQINAYS